MKTSEKQKIWTNRWRQKHPDRYAEYAKRNLEDIKRRYKEDPEFRERKKKIAREYWHKNKDKIRERRKSNPEYQAKQRAYHFTEMGRLTARRARLKKEYGLSIEQYEAMNSAQGGLCAICGSPEKHPDKWGSPFRRLRVDHDHKAKKVRGLLCHHCNAGIGHFKDNPEFLRKAIDYLRKYRMISSGKII